MVHIDANMPIDNVEISTGITKLVYCSSEVVMETRHKRRASLNDVADNSRLRLEILEIHIYLPAVALGIVQNC